ncbi:MAG: hypothetical protein Ct9H300mP28_21710 [Pseudomonadota bacterium]|nr:MAG: hypothetical protein Ct9H300mP28_21710 [Pseudomonadota bacterium]
MDLYWEIETTITPEKRIITTNLFSFEKDHTGKKGRKKDN